MRKRCDRVSWVLFFFAEFSGMSQSSAPAALSFTRSLDHFGPSLLHCKQAHLARARVVLLQSSFLEDARAWLASEPLQDWYDISLRGDVRSAIPSFRSGDAIIHGAACPILFKLVPSFEQPLVLVPRAHHLTARLARCKAAACRSVFSRIATDGATGSTLRFLKNVGAPFRE